MKKVNETDQKKDRRVRRTRRLLNEGLMTLLLEKDVKDISVKELADYADINRGTFYLHYKDVFDMLEKIEEDFFLDINRILDENTLSIQNPKPIDLISDVFYYFADHQTAVAAMLGAHGDLAFVNRIKQLIQDRIAHLWQINQMDPAQFPYFYAFIISGCIGLIESWVQSGFKENPREMSLLAGKMVSSSLNSFV